MRTSLISIAMFIAAVSGASAQAPGPTAPPDCSGPEFHQFDFWIGEWQVTAGGSVAGSNRIEPLLDGCALAEHWTSATGGRGESLNFYDRASGRWHQAWTDARGQALLMSGGLFEGSMVMRTEPVTAADGTVRVHRTMWTPLPDGTVRQHWETSTDGGVTWTTVFDGLYERQE